MRLISARVLRILSCCLVVSHARAGAIEPTTLDPSRTALRRLLLAESAQEERRGGDIALARRRYELAGAQTTDAWLDWLPDFSAALRRQIAKGSDPGASTPRWRVDIQSQAVLSLQKLATVASARAAQTKAHAELAETQHTLTVTTLISCLARYVAERKALVVEEHLTELGELVDGMRTGKLPAPEGGGEELLIKVRVEELRSSLAEIELERQRASSRLISLSLHDSSGLDPHMDLNAMLSLVREAMADSPSRADDVEQSDLELAQKRVDLAETRRWYVPELRAAAVALLPKSDVAGSGNSAFHLESITGELTLDLHAFPGEPFLRAAAAQGVARSRWLARQARSTRARIADQARVLRDALSELWSDERGLVSASAGFDDVSRRFARGERSAAELAEASRTLTDARLEREVVFEQAVVAQIALTAASGADTALPPTSRARQIDMVEVERLSARAVADAPSVNAARAEAERAAQAARAESYRLRYSLEAGVLCPLLQRESSILELRPELGLAGAGLAPIAVRETSLLGRWSMNLLDTGRSFHVLERESALRQAQAELSRKSFLWDELLARLEVSHARAGSQHAELRAAFFRENLEQEHHSFAEGAATAEDVRSAERAAHTALAVSARAAARLEAAELMLAQKLGAPRGSRVTVAETPAALEAWARDRFIPQQQLLGFASALTQRVAELQVGYTEAQAESLTSPPRSVTLTAEATQGLLGGAYSLTLGVGVALDPTREPTKIVRAAELAGAATGRLGALRRELDDQRAQATHRAAEAADLMNVEASIQRDIHSRIQSVRAEQAGATGESSTLKQRELAALRAALLESEARALDDDERRSTAGLQALSLGAGLERTDLRSGTFRAALSTLTETDADVASADAAARQAERANPAPVVTSLHLAGPFVAGSYPVTRVAGPSTTRTLQANLGLGASIGLDEAVAFVANADVLESAQLERRAARTAAARAALRDIAQTWTARELARLGALEETEARRYFEDSVLPRFKLGLVATELVTAAQNDSARATVRRSAAESRLKLQLASLQARGALVSDMVLDEYASKTDVLLSADVGAALAPSRAGSEGVNSREGAARARRGAARAEALATALRVVSPVTGLVELRPANIRSETGRPGAEQNVSSGELLWVLSMIVPVRPKVLGSVGVELARSQLANEELGATSRERQRSDALLRTELYARRQSYAVALQAERASERARGELERRLRAGEDQTTLDDVVRARQVSFDAQRALIEAKGAALAAQSAISAEGMK